MTSPGHTMILTAWHTPDMNSAPQNHSETTHRMLFLKNAYRVTEFWICGPEYSEFPDQVLPIGCRPTNRCHSVADRRPYPRTCPPPMSPVMSSHIWDAGHSHALTCLTQTLSRVLHIRRSALMKRCRSFFILSISPSYRHLDDYLY